MDILAPHSPLVFNDPGEGHDKLSGRITATNHDKAGVGISTVQAIEAAEDAATVDAGGLETTRDYREGARAESLGKIAKAQGAAGVTFLPDDGKGPGIRGRASKAKR